jgi:hypothetical protein
VSEGEGVGRAPTEGAGRRRIFVTAVPRTGLGGLAHLAILALVALLLSTCSTPPAATTEPTTRAAATATGSDGASSPRPTSAGTPRVPEPDSGSAAGDPGPEVGSAERPAEPAEEEIADHADAPLDHAAHDVNDLDSVVDLADATDAAEDLDLDATVAPAEPTRVVVPRIRVDSSLVPVGLHPDRTLVVPDEAHVAGWYTGRPRPGEPGPAIVTGHNQWKGSLGVFWDLHRLVPGDVIEIHHDDGSVVRFEVDRLEQHPKDAFPTERVYGPTDDAEIRVITCGGVFDRSRRSHVDNVIAFGVRVD